MRPGRRLAAVCLAMAVVSLAGPGCRGKTETSSLQAHRAVADRVAGVMDELQKRRTAIQPESDIGEVLAGLRVNQQPPEPAPEPVAEAPVDPAEASPDAPAAEPAPASVFRLQGIVWSAKAPLAIINKRTVGVGESVDGRRVERITRDGATIVGPDGEKLELRLYEPTPSQP